MSLGCWSIGRQLNWIAAKLAEASLKKTEDLLKPEKTISDNHLRILDIDIDIVSGTVWRDGEVVDLPDLSFRLLRTLATRAPAMVSKDELIAEVWGDVIVSDETLMQRVRLLRQALGDDSQNPRYIAAVRGRGYRLSAPVEGGGWDEEHRVRITAASAPLAIGHGGRHCCLGDTRTFHWPSRRTGGPHNQHAGCAAFQRPE
jgi:DNA-binding winged helix-turn-helix (wHTH) protein